MPVKNYALIPTCIQEISHIPMKSISASGYSASISKDTQSLYVWGSSLLGEFDIPHRVKKVDKKVIKVEMGHNFGAALTEADSDGSRHIYTWGKNDKG